MIRSLRTGISGLKSNQIRMDVIGNNIANVNTAAFKRSRIAFNEVLGQRLIGLGRSAGGSGINPASIGNGVAVGGVDQDWGQGSLDYTGVGTDLALSGDGYFIARGAEGNVLTRAGNFTFNAAGELVTAGGLAVQGWAYDDNGVLNTGQVQTIRLNLDENSAPRETENVTINGNLSADIDHTDPDNNTVTVSTVTYDGQGKAHTVVLTLEKTGIDEWSVDSAQLANPDDPDAPTDLQFGSTAADGTFTAGAVTIEFNNDGTLATPTSFAISGTYPGTDNDDVALTMDIEQLTQYGGSTTATVADQDGQAAGRVIGYGIDPSGTLSLNFSNGEQRSVARLAIGSVTNPNGLEQLGENFYGVTGASGDLTIGRAGQEVNTAVIAGALETSNVDLATEFTDMIVTQRGYQAAARVITTSDELLQEVVQLKR